MMVLDASAVLAVILNEPGSDMVVASFSEVHISTVNLSEVYAKLLERDVALTLIVAAVAAMDLRIRTFDPDQMVHSALLRPQTKAFGLSFADRACAALAQSCNCSVLTSDTRFAATGPALGIDIRMIR